MPDIQRLQLLNSVETSLSAGFDSFHLFPRLPYELRSEIWRLPLRNERLIQIGFRGKSDSRAEESYSITVDGPRLFSKVFHINQESRDAAMKFYRVHMPCIYLRRSTPRGLVVSKEHCNFLFINPELEILQFWYDDPGRNFACFLADIKAADPRHVGLLNLACDYCTTIGLSEFDLTELSPSIRKCFIETIAKLKNVYFVIYDELPIGIKDGWNLQRHGPVSTSISTFVRVGLDPRNIQTCLQSLNVAVKEPYGIISSWQKLLRQWQVEPQCTSTHQLIFAQDQVLARPLRRIVDRLSAKDFVPTEEERCRRRPDSDPARTAAIAIGFWIFPIDAFIPRPGPGVDLSEIIEVPHPVIDLSNHWPELALASLV
jgi:hypothetical protein